MSAPAAPLTISKRQRSILEELAYSADTPQRLAQRAHIILMSAAGLSNAAQAREEEVDVQTVRLWRGRWREGAPQLQQAESSKVKRRAMKKRLKKIIIELLTDRERAGAPPSFSAEQLSHLFALACQLPQELGLPFSQWTGKALADELNVRGIVESISPRHVQRLLSEAQLRPHKVEYWLNPKIEDEEAFREEVKVICDIYHQAPDLEDQGVHVVCCDEKTGIQAKERAKPTRPVKPGISERQEYEYIRHGTLCLIASFHVTSGRLITPTLGPTRTELDFLHHVQATIATAPQDKWIFVVDQLDTHQSESLVHFVAEREKLNIDLGVKGKSGILKSKKSRKAFLSKECRQIRFIYTPKHCSWLNQVEMWFSILTRRLLKRGSFTSLDHLRDQISAFIEHFNVILAKPFQWTYKGKPLAS